MSSRVIRLCREWAGGQEWSGRREDSRKTRRKGRFQKGLARKRETAADARERPSNRRWASSHLAVPTMSYHLGPLREVFLKYRLPHRTDPSRTMSDPQLSDEHALIRVLMYLKQGGMAVYFNRWQTAMIEEDASRRQRGHHFWILFERPVEPNSACLCSLRRWS